MDFYLTKKNIFPFCILVKYVCLYVLFGGFSSLFRFICRLCLTCFLKLFGYPVSICFLSQLCSECLTCCGRWVVILSGGGRYRMVIVVKNIQ